MKKQTFSFLIFLFCLATGVPAAAQNVIYRCGNEYTNDANHARENRCKRIEGGNITVVPAGTGGSSGRSAASPNGASSAPRVNDTTQQERDKEARYILETELGKAKNRLAELRGEYKDGQPDKLGPEAKNYQKYLDRVAALKGDIERTESDIAGIERELARLPAQP